MMKTGMVLEGGAMRGMYTAGVTDVLCENEVWVDGVLGVSAGVTFGVNYKSRQVGRTIRYNKKYCGNPNYYSIRSWLRTGDVFNVHFSYHRIPFELDPFDEDAYEANHTDFYVTVTDVETGKPVYHQIPTCNEHDLLWIRASASMPGFSRVVEVDGGRYLDGGASDSIPLRAFEDMGYQRNLVVLTQVEGYRKKPAGLVEKLAYELSLHKIPAMKKVMLNRADMYNTELDYVAAQQRAGAAYVLRPSVDLGVSRLERNPEKLQAMYDLGRADALAHLDEIGAFLGR